MDHGLAASPRRLGLRPSVAEWQNRLLPLMTVLIIGLAVLFFVSGFLQFYFMQRLISSGPQLDSGSLVVLPEVPSGELRAVSPQLIRWKTLAMLEAHALNLRYHQIKIFLMSKIWTRFMGLVTGITLTLVGSAFILGKLQESPSQVQLTQQSVSFSMVTASPGLVLGMLGTVLMLVSMLSTSDFDIKDRPIYTDATLRSTEDRVLATRSSDRSTRAKERLMQLLEDENSQGDPS